MSILRSRFGEVLPEECCFECKDGGDDLRLCDYKNCLKAYHPDCTVSKTGYGFPPGEFICNWHACVNCRKSPDYQCLCCPNYSVCQNCLRKVEFFKLGTKNKGLCGFCLGRAMSIEKYAGDPRAKSNYLDSDVSLLLFNDYWSIVKDMEHLTLVDLQVASGIFDEGLYHTCEADSEKIPDEDNKTDEDLLGDSDDNGQTFPSGLKSKPDKINPSVKRKRSNKKRFIGWGTKELIEFLSCFGKDTKEPLDEAEVVGVVQEYIKQKGLFVGDKKRYFECDDKLRPLFTRRKVRYNMLHSKLQLHLAVNASSEEESLDGSEDGDCSERKKKPQASLEPKIAKRVSERHKRCLASLNYRNINLIYLRRNLFVDLLKNNKDTFELKVVGCFVRVRSNSQCQFFQKPKRSFQLGLVTGIKESQEEYRIKDTPTKVLLRVTGFWDDIKITMLSDEDIQEEECDELIPWVEKGILKRATVAEFEEKVAAVHTDIVNHWINRELERLEKRIDLANEKGWRQEMCALMDQKKLLSTQAERQRLIEEVPEIAADAEDEKQTELKITAGNSCQVNIGEKRDKTTCLVAMKENSKEARPPVADTFDVLKEKPTKEARPPVADSLDVLKEKPPKEARPPVADSFDVLKEKQTKARPSVSDSLDAVKDKPPKGVAEYASESFDVLKEKPPEGATEQAVNAFDILNEETSKGAADQIADSLRVRVEESPIGATKKMAHSYSLSLNEESLEVASKQGDTTHEVAFEAGEAFSSGVTPDPVLHSPVYTAQDGSKIQAIDIGKDESNNTKHNKSSNLPIHEVINLDSTDDEDEHGPGRQTVHPPGTMNAGNFRMGQPKSWSCASLRAEEARDRYHRESKAVRAVGNEMLHHSYLWHYADPKGNSRGPFLLATLNEWYMDGFFNADFKVWRAGQTKEQAILFTDAYRMYY